MLNTRLIEYFRPVWACVPQNYSGTANTVKWANLKGYGRMAILIQTGAWAGGTAAVTLNQATSTAGAGSKALAFTSVYINTGAAPDTFTKTAVSSNTFNLDTANLLYWIEVVDSDLDTANGFNCVDVAIASPGANADFYGVIYLMGTARYPQSPTATPSALS